MPARTGAGCTVSGAVVTDCVCHYGGALAAPAHRMCECVCGGWVGGGTCACGARDPPETGNCKCAPRGYPGALVANCGMTYDSAFAYDYYSLLDILHDGPIQTPAERLSSLGRPEFTIPKAATYPPYKTRVGLV